MIGRDHAQGAARLAIVIIRIVAHVRAGLPIGYQDGAKGEYIRRAHVQIFLRRVRVAQIGFHAAVVKNGQHL